MDISDIGLWDDLRNGQESVLKDIYIRHQKSLFQYGMRIVPDADVVSDCLHNLFLKLWTNHKKLSPTDNIRFYLMSSLRNEIINFNHREKRYTDELSSDLDYFDLNFSVEAAFIMKEQHDQLAVKIGEAMNKLTGRQKEIIYLRYFEELSYEEIAEMMDITVKGAYKLSARALESLRMIVGVDRIGLLLFFFQLRSIVF